MAYNSETENRALLELYLEGETTLEQEVQLREFFATADVPEDLKYAKAMFGFFTAASADACCSEITVDFSSDGGQNPAKGGNDRSKVRSLLTGRLAKFLSVAAAAAVVCVVTINLIRDHNSPLVYCYVNGEPVIDQQVAERQAQMVHRILQGTSRMSRETMDIVMEAGEPLRKVERRLENLGLTLTGNND